MKRRLSVGLVIGVVAASLVTVVPAGAATAWVMKPSPNVGTNTNFLYGVSCATAKSCMSVGFYTSPGVNKTLAQSWNGSVWKVTPTPSPGGVWNYLYGVSCLSVDSCVAVGTYKDESGINKTLIESWNGSSWSIVPSPNPAQGNNILNGVSCLSASFCVAAGSWQSGGITRALILKWNGKNWAKQNAAPSPVGTIGSSFSGVSCTTIYYCVAVGSSLGNKGLDRTRIDTWNGKIWVATPSPNSGPLGNALTGVSCVSAVTCSAVGTKGTGAFGKGGVQKTLAMTWTRKGWLLIPSANRGTFPNVFSGVSCLSGTKCWAVGWYQETAGGPRRTLIEASNGKQWAIVSSPNPAAGVHPDNYLGVTGAALNGVSCRSAALCRAGGFSVGSGGIDQTLVESYG